jgi:hypothetical protein
MALRKRFKWLALAALLLVAGAAYYRLQFHKPLRQVTYSQFLADARSGHLAEVHIGETELVGLVRREKDSAAVPEVVARRLPGVELSAFLKEMEASHIPVAAAKDTAATWTAAAGWLFPMLLLLTIGALVAVLATVRVVAVSGRSWQDL